MTVLVLSLVAAAGFWLATWLTDTTLGGSRTFHHFAVVVAAAILLGVTFSDLAPESIALLGARDAALAIAAGFVALFLVETLTSGHTHHHAGDAGAHAHAHAHSHAHAHAHSHGHAHQHAMLPFLIGLTLHNFTDGLVIGTSHEVSDAAASGVAVGILIHQLPVGLSFAAVLLASGASTRHMRRLALLVGLAIVAGALVVIAAPTLTASALGVLIGVAAGALLYIATGHLLPEAHSEERRPGIAAAFAVTLIGTILLLGVLHEHAPAHEHAHADANDEHAHADEHDADHDADHADHAH